MIHILKIEQKWYDRVMTGRKRAEVRRHDRDFQVGDTLWLEVPDVYDWKRGHKLRASVKITHVLPGTQVEGVDDDFCVLSIKLNKRAGDQA